MQFKIPGMERANQKNLLGLLIFSFAINSLIFTCWFNELWKNTMNGLYQWKKIELYHMPCTVVRQNPFYPCNFLNI